MTRSFATAALAGLMAAAWLTVACHGPTTPSPGGTGPGGTNPVVTQPCPASGLGAVTSAGPCWVFSPATAGASPLGQNANRLNYALEPAGPARRTLVVLLNGSGSFPAQLTIDPSRNLFTSALESGNHVLAVAYRSDVALVAMCGNRPDCYGPSRRTLVTGVFAPGADTSVADIREDEGIVARIDQALRTLAAARPQAGWDAFVGTATASAPADRIAWPRIIASGHSQGGGHAAYLGKLFPLFRWCSSRRPAMRPPASPLPGPPPIPVGRRRPRRLSLACPHRPCSPAEFRLQATSTVPITLRSGRTSGCHCRTRTMTRLCARASTHTPRRSCAARTTRGGSSCSAEVRSGASRIGREHRQKSGRGCMEPRSQVVRL